MMLKNHCFLCHCPCTEKEILCHNCYNDLPFNVAACLICAKPFCNSNICAKCLQSPSGFINSTFAPFLYHYPVNHLIQHMKFKQCLSITNYLANLLAKHYYADPKKLPDCIIPVPLHRTRLITRGYNQSIELARPLAKKLAIKLDTNYCKRIRITSPQTSLSKKERSRNVYNAFAVSTKKNYKHVLLVDDVITSGSTIKEISRTFKKAGVKSMNVLACAKAVQY